jgi:hypothetical protein
MEKAPSPAGPGGSRIQSQREGALEEHLEAYASVLGAPSLRLTRAGLFSSLESSEGVDLAEGCRDLDDHMLTIRIGFPGLDVPLWDKDVDPQPRDEVDPVSSVRLMSSQEICISS